MREDRFNEEEKEVLAEEGWNIQEEKIEKSIGKFWCSIPCEDISDIINFNFDEEEYIREYYSAKEDISPFALMIDSENYPIELYSITDEIDEMEAVVEDEDFYHLPIEEVVPYLISDISLGEDNHWYASTILPNSLIDERLDLGEIKNIGEVKQKILSYIETYDKDEFVKNKLGASENLDVPVMEVADVADGFLTMIDELTYNLEALQRFPSYDFDR